MQRFGLSGAVRRFQQGLIRRRFKSTQSQPPPSPSPSPSSSSTVPPTEGPQLNPKTQSKTIARLDRWIVRSPKFFKPSLITLRNAPASYIVSFAIVHEITAVVPLFALASAFHYYRWLPPYFAEGKWALEGVEKLGRWFKRRGWISEREEAEVEREMQQGNARGIEKHKKKISNVWNKGEDAGRWLVELASAWAVVKVLLPFRIVLSVWWAPGFARMFMLPITRAVVKRFKRVKT